MTQGEDRITIRVVRSTFLHQGALFQGFNKVTITWDQLQPFRYL